MKLFFFYTTVLSIFFLNCTKESTKKECWTVVDNLGNQIAKICDKTENEMNSVYSNPCSFLKYEDKTYCWMSNGGFLKNVTESEMSHLVKCFGMSPGQKVDCGYCEKLFSREKRTYKPASTTTYTTINVKTYCGNELTAIPASKQIIRKDDADSLIVIQYSIDGTNW